MESEAPSINWQLGCLRAACTAMIAVVALPLGTCAWLEWDAPRGQLPSSVPYVSVLHSSQSTGLREGCFEAIYTLAPETIARLRRGGVAMLNGSTIRKENDRNPYGEWMPTPLPFVRIATSPSNIEIKAKPYPRSEPLTLFAEGAAWGCDAQSRVPVSVSKMLANPGGFYAITANAEGLIVIDTQQGLAAVLYEG